MKGSRYVCSLCHVRDRVCQSVRSVRLGPGSREATMFDYGHHLLPHLFSHRSMSGLRYVIISKSTFNCTGHLFPSIYINFIVTTF